MNPSRFEGFLSYSRANGKHLLCFLLFLFFLYDDVTLTVSRINKQDARS